MSMTWDRKLWGIQFSSKGEAPMLIGGNWHPANNPRYIGEPSRPILFTTRKLAREWCAEKMAIYRDRNDNCKYWRFRPVRVTETVHLTKRAPDGVVCPACKSTNTFEAVICVNCGAHTAPRR